MSIHCVKIFNVVNQFVSTLPYIRGIFVFYILLEKNKLFILLSIFQTCSEKEAVMKRENNQFINLTLLSISSECEVIRHPGDKSTYHCKGSRTFRSVRERWWFIAVSNCDSDKVTLILTLFTRVNIQ